MVEYSDEEYLSLFLRTVDEYNKIVDMFPSDLEKNVYLGIEDSDIVAVSIRAFLLRKFITRNDNVHIGKIIKKAINVFPEIEQNLQKLYSTFIEKYNENMIQIDASGRESNLREVFDDVIYGIYLHADFERVERLNNSTDYSRYLLLRRLVSSMEDIFSELYETIKTENPELIQNQSEFERAVVVRDFETNEDSLKGEGYWENLVVEELNDPTMKEIIQKQSLQDLLILQTAGIFVRNIIDRKISFDDMKDIVFLPTMSDWNDFSGAIDLVTQLGECGMGTTVKYSEERDVAYVKILKNVGEGFTITQEQSIPTEIVTLIVDERISQWRVFSFGSAIDPLVRKRKNFF